MKWSLRSWSLRTCKLRAFTEKGVAVDRRINPLKRSWFTMSKLSNSPVNTTECYPAHKHTHLKCRLPPVLSFFHVVSSHPSKDTQMTLQTGCKCVMQVIHKTLLVLQVCLPNLTQCTEVDADKRNRLATCYRELKNRQVNLI